MPLVPLPGAVVFGGSIGGVLGLGCDERIALSILVIDVGAALRKLQVGHLGQCAVDVPVPLHILLVLLACVRPVHAWTAAFRTAGS